MSGNLGNRPARGVLSANNKITAGGWVATFDPAIMPSQGDYEVYAGTITGPGGYFRVYLDEQLRDVGLNGVINSYDPNQAMYVLKGQTISFHWSIATGTAPLVILYLRQPEVGKFT